MAKVAKAQGDVLISAIIEKDGTLRNIKLISGHPILAAAALDAVQQMALFAGNVRLRSHRGGDRNQDCLSHAI